MQPSSLSGTKPSGAVAVAPNMSTSTSSPRLTPANPRVPFSEVMKGAATAGAELAMRTLPGGPAIAVAVRGGTVPAGGFGGTGFASAPRLGTSAAPVSMTAEGPTGGGASSGTGGVATTPGTSSEAQGFDQAMAHSQEMNLYFLRVQEEVNAQNRTFTTLSNVMKAEHETVKTAIGNIR